MDTDGDCADGHSSSSVTERPKAMNVEVSRIPVWKVVKSGKTLELAGLIGNVCEDVEVGLQLKRKARVFVLLNSYLSGHIWLTSCRS